MRQALKLLLTVLVSILTVYGLASVWYPDSIAESISWMWCLLLFARDLLLTLAIASTAVTVFAWIWCKWGRAGIAEGTKCVKLCLGALPSNPFPATVRGKITGFKYKSDLDLKRFAKGLKGVVRKDQYIVAAPYSISFRLDGHKHCITVPKGMLTDLSSAPFPFNCIVGRVGPHLEATIVHDYLYVAWQDYPAGLATRANRRFADKLMLEGMKASGMHCMAYLIYWAIRLAGCGAFYGRNPIRYVDLGQCKCCDEEGGSCCEGNSCDDCEPRPDGDTGDN